MHLEQSIVVTKNSEEVWAFLGSVENVTKWDRGVGRTATTRRPVEGALGLEFDTFVSTSGTDEGKMSYRIINVTKNSCTVQLTSNTGNARFFKKASWTLETRPEAGGTLLICRVDFEAKLRFSFLAPLLYINRRAIAIDLECLKQAIERRSPGVATN